MKKIMKIFLAISVLFVVAYASDGEFTNWNALKTYSGCIMGTAIITQLIKFIPYVGKINSQILSYVVAVAILITSTYFTGGLDVSEGVLCLVNAAIASLASNGLYDVVTVGSKEEKSEYIHEEE